ncbi:MAG: biopolymer transporter ExbD [Bacteroidia bacterium]|nr:biopolymer transporter ExbD [Bacteroidia bacterium]
MPKIKMPKNSPELDMTPMVDLAFLLVTFFMLTAQFRAEEPVIVTIPSSQKNIPVPDKDVLTVTVDSVGRVFFNIDNKAIRSELLQMMGSKYQITFTEEEIKRFSLMQSFGGPMTQMKDIINASETERSNIYASNKGIPVDSAKASTNQLKDWINFSRLASAQFYQKQGFSAPKEYNRLRCAIKGDGRSDYIAVKEVIGTFQLEEIGIHKFNLLTSLEGPATN